jgi:hypothetical protein
LIYKQQFKKSLYLVFAVINLRGVFTNKTIICFIAMQTYKELNLKKVSLVYLPVHVGTEDLACAWKYGHTLDIIITQQHLS